MRATCNNNNKVRRRYVLLVLFCRYNINSCNKSNKNLYRLLIKAFRKPLRSKYTQDKNSAISLRLCCDIEAIFCQKSFGPLTRAGVLMRENFNHRKSRDLSNRASPASHMDKSRFLGRKERRDEISETELARLTRPMGVVIDNFTRLRSIWAAKAWFWNKSSDQLTVNNICPTGFAFHHLPRKHSRGGGVALLYKSRFKLKKLSPNFLFKSLEFTDCTLTYASTSLRMVVVYRPRPSQKNRLSVTLFLDEFSSLLEKLIISTGH